METHDCDDKPEENQVSDKFKNVFQSLLLNADIVFKSQQRGEAEPGNCEKMQIIQQLFDKNKTNFLLKFGKYFTCDELDHFMPYTEVENDPEHYEENKIVLNDLRNNLSHNRKVEIKNRRYMALQQLIQEDSYFSELEMMKRNPLLYDQLVGQYLSEKERKERDSSMDENTTLVKILYESIDRQEMETSKKQQEEEEQATDSDEDSSDDDNSSKITEPSTSLWGEYETSSKKKPEKKRKTPCISAEERLMLRKEFVTTMYQSFLDGNDSEFFDYSAVDSNVSFNNEEEMDQDAEDKYFDSDDVETGDMMAEGESKRESSEDELDVYMEALNQHQDICDLAMDIKRNLITST